MSVQFLSAEWATAMTEALSTDPTMRVYTRGQDTVFHMNVTDGPADKHGYYLHFDDGSCHLSVDAPREPDTEAFISYPDMTALFKGELDGGLAMATGRLTVGKGVDRAIKAGNALNRIPSVAKTVDISY
jgi:putative sterol carrier protein